MLDPATHDLFTEATVNFVLEARRQYLATGASALSHWTMLTTRLQHAPRVCATVEEMTTEYLRKLQITDPSRDCSSAILTLRRVVEENGGPRPWLAFVEREWAFVIANAREVAEHRRAARLIPTDSTHAPPDPAVVAAVEHAIAQHNEEMT